MAITKFNDVEKLLKQYITAEEHEMKKMKNLIGENTVIHTAVIDEEWLEEQYLADDEEIDHQKYGRVRINVDIRILEIIKGNALVENKHIYHSLETDDVYELSMFFYGPIDKELIDLNNGED